MGTTSPGRWMPGATRRWPRERDAWTDGHLRRFADRRRSSRCCAHCARTHAGSPRRCAAARTRSARRRRGWCRRPAADLRVHLGSPALSARASPRTPPAPPPGSGCGALPRAGCTSGLVTTGAPALRLSDGDREWVVGDGSRAGVRDGPARTSCSAPSPVAAARCDDAGPPVDDGPRALARPSSRRIRYRSSRLRSPTPSHPRASTGRRAPHPTPKGRTPMSPSPPPRRPPLDELRDKQQQVWSSGDYNRIAALTVPVSERLVDERRRRARRARPRRRHRHRPRRPRRRPPRCAGRPASTTCPSCSTSPGAGPPPRSSTSSSSRPTPRTCPSATARSTSCVSAIGVMFAADHARAAASSSGWPGPAAASRWRAGPRGLRRRHARGRRPARRPAARRAAADPLGRRGRRRRAASATRSTSASVTTPSAAVRPRRGLRRPVPHLLRPDSPRPRRLDEDGRAALRADLVALAPLLRQGRRQRFVSRLGVPHRHGDPPVTDADRPSSSLRRSTTAQITTTQGENDVPTRSRRSAHLDQPGVSRAGRPSGTPT